MSRKTKVLPTEPNCSYRCSTVGALLIIKAFIYCTGNSEKKHQGFSETFQGTRFPNGKPSRFLISETERTAPSLSRVFRIRLKKMQFESALHARHPFPCSSTFTATSSLREKDTSRYITNIKNLLCRNVNHQVAVFFFLPFFLLTQICLVLFKF